MTGKTVFERYRRDARRMADRAQCDVCILTIRDCHTLKTAKEAAELLRDHPEYVRVFCTVKFIPDGDAA